MDVEKDQARVKAFNSLPCKSLSPSRMVPNTWYFDLRYISIDPPSHMLFLYQPGSHFIHTEPLPHNNPPEQPGIAFFPENGEQAATEVVKVIMHGFLNSFGIGHFEQHPPDAFAPFKLMTEDSSLAREVGKELKRIGVTHKNLWNVQVAPDSTLRVAHENFKTLYGHMKTRMGLKVLAFASFETPCSIVFLNPSRYKEMITRDDSADRTCAYMSQLRNAKLAEENFSGDKMMKELDTLSRLFETRPLDTVKREADGGNGMSAIDYALRVRNGIGCTPNRATIHEYLVKAIQTPSSNDVTKSIAHSLLINWYTDALKPDHGLPIRYLLAAAYHADQAVTLAHGNASPAVLFFGLNLMKPAAEKVLQLYAQFKNVWSAVDKRNEEIEKERIHAQTKRMEKPNRYRCANVGCLIQTDTGKMLRQCSGKCDPDKKPSYCSKECVTDQKADWKNHKPFCKPGQLCSVIAPESDYGMIRTHSGALSIPIQHSNERTTLLSSSTWSAEDLRKIKRELENKRT
ncbi:hypothetical protein K435DRAFT_776905 [Dendrothele bispora CBS 962.96]|uniref:MYND-type domain-containing protein n=1 Tax=Dendrothele bispora (strain CBS 962.96) TaxID=1314807 RepID=A0A4S8MBR2_DENBC|nr:hypothetical protein K435DRAFT_776905 [Dendrothele bispora CBS 962.96]